MRSYDNLEGDLAYRRVLDKDDKDTPSDPRKLLCTADVQFLVQVLAEHILPCDSTSRLSLG